MKPLNLDNRPCSPISSNCVIWQGNNIPCINLCTGDSVSDVVFKLATELCLIMDELDITNYDLDCLVSNSPAPESFQELIQLLITKVCNTNNIPVPPEKSGACPDCIVSVASCFVEGTQTTMQLVDYVQMIAEKVCDIIDEISIINNQIINLDNRVTILENTPPPTFTLPSISTNCLSDYMGFVTTAPIDQILNTLLSNGTIGYCTLIQATGLPADLLTAVASQCITSTDLSLKSQAEGDSPINPMGTEYFGSWVNTPVTVADAITNLWISLCDLRSGVKFTVVEAGDNITVTSSTVGNTTTYTVNADVGEVTMTDTCDVIFTEIPTPAPDKNFSATLADTGWDDLLGQSFVTDDSNGLIKAKVRVYGKLGMLRGMLHIPLDNGFGLPVPITSTEDLLLNTDTNPLLSGPDGVDTFVQGGLKFRNDSTLFPGTVPTPGYTYRFPVTIQRRTALDGGAVSTVLVAPAFLIMFDDGRFTLQSIVDIEEATGYNNAGFGPSAWRYLSSNVRAGEYTPDFINSSTNVHTNPSTGVQPVEIDYSAYTYRFDCDASNVNQMGGFYIELNGLTFLIDC